MIRFPEKKTVPTTTRIWRRVIVLSLILLLCPSGGVEAQEGIAPDRDYRIGPEDVLQISVWRDDSLSRDVLVRPDGMISFPLVGDVLAEGRTVEELRSDLLRRLSPFVADPAVTVMLLKNNSYKVYVIGKVNRPGEYLVGHRTDVLQALALAGGLTPFASENRIHVLRRGRQGNQGYPFRYGDIRKGKGMEQNILLERGDVVLVP